MCFAYNKKNIYIIIGSLFKNIVISSIWDDSLTVRETNKISHVFLVHEQICSTTGMFKKQALLYLISHIEKLNYIYFLISNFSVHNTQYAQISLTLQPLYLTYACFANNKKKI